MTETLPLTRLVATQPSIVIAIDVANLNTSDAFYQRLLGFQPVATVRQGLLFEERHMASARVPGFLLILREAFGKRPIGTQPGTVLRIGFGVKNLREAASGLDPATHWQHPLPAAPAAAGETIGDDKAAPGGGSTQTFARLTDPDGYIIELFEGTPGSGF